MIETVPLTKSLMSSAGKMLAQAFCANPAHAYIFQDEGTRFAKLEWLLRANLKAQKDLESSSFCLTTGSELDAMGFWAPPGAHEPGILSKIRAGLLAAPFRCGLAELRRAQAVTNEIERQKRAALQTTRYWYLNNMVVHEKRRGSGVGSALLRDQIEQRRGREPAAVFALVTQRQENVTFYGRLGFEIVADEMVFEGPFAFRNWVMVNSADNRSRAFVEPGRRPALNPGSDGLRRLDGKA